MHTYLNISEDASFFKELGDLPEIQNDNAYVTIRPESDNSVWIDIEWYVDSKTRDNRVRHEARYRYIPAVKSHNPERNKEAAWQELGAPIPLQR
jgi:hypothetical protein